MSGIPELRGGPAWLQEAWKRSKVLAEDRHATLSCDGFKSDQLAVSQSKGPVPAPKELLGSPCYYRFREQDFRRRHPDQPPPAYYRDYGEKYALRFTHDLMPGLSETGIRFVKRTRQELQQAIEGKLVEDPNAFDRLEQDGEAFKEFAYDSHAGAYLRGGIADLSLVEKLKVAKIPDAKDLFTWDGLAQMAEVAFGIVKQSSVNALRRPILTGPSLMINFR